MTSYNLIVGTFNTPELYTLTFTPPQPSSQKASLTILKRHSAIGSHSWLALSASKRNLYATCWTDPPTIAAYAIDEPSNIRLLNAAPTNSRSGYVCCSNTHVYSAGGATGEVFAIERNTGSLVSGSLRQPEPQTNGHTEHLSRVNGTTKDIQPVQRLNFVSDTTQRDDGSTMDFGGLRHGAHSADLSPDGKILYVADIGRNCIWSYLISDETAILPHSPSRSTLDHLSLIEKYISPRAHDGPRHVWPHPSGKVVYVLQEHSSMVDVFSVNATDHKLQHVQGVRIIPPGLPVSDFWADEVRTSFSHGTQPQYLYASTRGLKNGRRGYIAVFGLDNNGLVKGARRAENQETQNVHDQDQGGLLCMYETATSGGWANAIQPGPTVNGIEYLAMTDSEVGYVFVLSWDGSELREVARVTLTHQASQNGEVVGAATAVWL